MSSASPTSSDYTTLNMPPEEDLNDDVGMTHTGRIIRNGGMASPKHSIISPSPAVLNKDVPMTEMEPMETFESKMSGTYRPPPATISSSSHSSTNYFSETNSPIFRPRLSPNKSVEDLSPVQADDGINFFSTKTSCKSSTGPTRLTNLMGSAPLSPQEDDNDTSQPNTTTTSASSSGAGGESSSSRQSPIPVASFNKAPTPFGSNPAMGARKYDFLVRNPANPTAEAVFNTYQESEKLKKARQKKRNKENKKDKGVIVYETQTKEEDYDPNKVLEFLGEAPTNNAKDKKKAKPATSAGEGTKKAARKKKEASPTESKSKKESAVAKESVANSSDEDEEVVVVRRTVNGKTSSAKKTPEMKEVARAFKDAEISEMVDNAAFFDEDVAINDPVKSSIESLSSFTTVTKKKKKKNVINNNNNIDHHDEINGNFHTSPIYQNGYKSTTNSSSSSYRPTGANYAGYTQRNNNNNRDNNATSSHNYSLNSSANSQRSTNASTASTAGSEGDNASVKSTNGDLSVPQSPPASSAASAAAPEDLDLGTAAFPALAPSAANFSVPPPAFSRPPPSQPLAPPPNTQMPPPSRPPRTTSVTDEAVAADSDKQDVLQDEEAEETSHNQAVIDNGANVDVELDDDIESSCCVTSGLASRDLSSRNSAASFFLDAENHVEIVTCEEEFNRRGDSRAGSTSTAPVVIMSRGESSYEDWTGPAAVAAGQVEFGFDINEELLSAGNENGFPQQQLQQQPQLPMQQIPLPLQQQQAVNGVKGGGIGFAPMNMDQFMAAAAAAAAASVAGGAAPMPAMPPSVPLPPHMVLPPNGGPPPHGAVPVLWGPNMGPPPPMHQPPHQQMQQQQWVEGDIEAGTPDVSDSAVTPLTETEEDPELVAAAEASSSGASTPKVSTEELPLDPVALANYLELVNLVANSWDRVEQEIKPAPGNNAKSLGVTSH